MQKHTAAKIPNRTLARALVKMNAAMVEGTDKPPVKRAPQVSVKADRNALGLAEGIGLRATCRVGIGIGRLYLHPAGASSMLLPILPVASINILTSTLYCACCITSSLFGHDSRRAGGSFGLSVWTNRHCVEIAV